MELFPERLVSDLARLPGGSHTYLKQVCGPDGSAVRDCLQRATERLGPVYEDRAADLLSSLDNRRFFQGFAEVATLSLLARAGWRLTRLVQPGPRIELVSPSGQPTALLVLAFLQQTRPGAEEETQRVLREALGRVRSKLRFVALVRRWLPHDFNPEPVRRAVEIWLGRMARAGSGERYATYDDEHVSLEFCVTGERVRGRQSPLALVMGPFLAHRTLSVVEPRVVAEADRHVNGPLRGLPAVLSLVADQPWALTPGYLRDLLLGRPDRTACEGGVTTETYGAAGSVALFRDPAYTSLSGLMLIDRRPAEPTRVRARAWHNPWASVPVPQDGFGVLGFCALPGGEGVSRVMRWGEVPAVLDIG